MALERDTILAALRRNGGNIGKAARELGAARRTLQNRMRAYGMPRGKSGRRKRLLPYARRSSGVLAGLGAAVVGAGLIVHFRRRAPNT